MPSAFARRAIAALFAIVFVAGDGLGASAAVPKVPDGFEARLVATVPAVVFPCQVATAPDGALFVAEDPMDQVGPYEAYDGRILVFRDGKESVVYAEGFRAIQGMAWHDGALYVSHMPFLTVVRDTDGDGKADAKWNLFKDLGPTDNRGLNDHIVSGIQFGIDGRLYVSVGDKGVPRASGPDGRVVQLKGGGTLRCRPDGTELEVYSSGTRNHLEANLDASDNLFTYDNTDDGDGWWTRVTHHVNGGSYGYPYDYHDRPDRMLPRMAEYQGGSPCGAVVYKEDVWPDAYRNVGFWAEWGKGMVHAFRFAPAGSTFQVAEAIQFATAQDHLDFRPIDLAVSYDGRTLYVADWGLGSWGQKQKVGRVFAITYKGEVKTRPRGKDSDSVAEQIRQLDHASFNERMRAQVALIKRGREALGAVETALADPRTDPVAARHLVWTIDGIAGGTPEGTAALVAALKAPAADVRAQAARALGERPVQEAAPALINLLADPEPSVRLQAVIGLGRIGDPKAVPALLPVLGDPDVFLAFSARQALKRIGDWKATAAGLASASAKVRAGVLGTLEEAYHVAAVAALAEFAADPSRRADERARAVEFLAEAHRKAKPWDGRWWGTRPSQGKPPEKVDPWEGTEFVLKAVRQALTDPAAQVRIAAVAGVLSTHDPEALPILRQRLADEPDTAVRLKVALALGALNDRESLPRLVALMSHAEVPEPVREAALTSVEALGTDLAAHALTDLLARPDLPTDRQPRLIASLGRLKATSAVPVLRAKLASPAALVRAAAVTALGKIGPTEGVNPRVRALLDDRDATVRKAAIEALAALRDVEAVPALIKAAESDETRFEATEALAAVPDLRALHVYLRGLADKSPDLRNASTTALAAIRVKAAPVLDQLATRKELSPSLLPELRRIYLDARPVLAWQVLGPLSSDAAPPSAADGSIDPRATHTGLDGNRVTWKPVQANAETGKVNLTEVIGGGNRSVFAAAEVASTADRSAQFAVGSDDMLTVWVNGKRVFDFDGNRSFEAAKDRFEAPLRKGTNRLVVKCGNNSGDWAFSVAIAPESGYAFLKGPAPGGFDPDAFRAFARNAKGDPAHGRALFADLKGLACIKCHAVGTQGKNVGPDLAGIGTRYPREELVTSVLNPSARIFSGYEQAVVALTDGRVVTGIVKADTPELLEIDDAEARRIKIPPNAIEARTLSNVSLMPAGLAQGLTSQDFADLIAFLEGLKEPPRP